MHKTLICVEKRDFHRIVDISRQYAGNDLKKCYVFNKKGYTAEFCKEKRFNEVECIVFGWSNYRLDLEGLEHGYDLTGIYLELKKAKNGYILMEFENNMLVNLKDRSRIDELGVAMNINKIVTKDDFSIAYNNSLNDNDQEIEEFE